LDIWGRFDCPALPVGFGEHHFIALELRAMVGDEGGFKVYGEVEMVRVCESAPDTDKIIFLFELFNQPPYCSICPLESVNEPLQLWVTVQGVDVAICFEENQEEPFFAVQEGIVSDCFFKQEVIDVGFLIP
jgi:hypothetical protein